MGDHEDAHRIATEAGELLLGIRAEAAAGRLDPSQLKDEGDRRSNELILERLRQTHPDDAVLSEERADDPSRVNSARTWIVDPLDGTREFGEDPRLTGRCTSPWSSKGSRPWRPWRCRPGG